MKIDFLHGITMPNFGSTELYKARIKQRFHDCEGAAPVDVFITRLDDSDIPRLKREEQDWLDTKFGCNIIDALTVSDPEVDELLGEKNIFYAIEMPLKNGQKQIRALAQLSKYKGQKKLNLEYMQVNNNSNMPDVIQGAGSCLLYAAINLAKKCEIEKFNLHSIPSAKGFYKHNGLRKIGNGFYLTKNLYDKVLGTLEKRYSITLNKEEPLL